MYRYEKLLEDAKKDLKIADHMINITYKLVNDPKMLLSITHRLLNTLTNIMTSILLYERHYKKIPKFNETFDSIFNLFKARCERRYNIDKEYLQIIQEIKNIINEHKKSPIVFSKENKLIICSDDYRLKKISIENIKKYINKIKLFHNEAERMVKING
ncbi:MAG: hypothetical protein ACOC3X_02280 [Nanoarchaeota archaeon]